MLRPGKKFYKRPSLIAAIGVLLLALLTVPTALVLTTQASERQEGTVLAYDEFDGKLNLDWEILHSDFSHWSLLRNRGTLTITTQDGHFTSSRTNYENLFLIDCPAAKGEDFQLTTCISSFKPVDEFNQAGLICYDDDDHYLSLIYAWSSGYVTGYGKGQRQFSALVEKGEPRSYVDFRAHQQFEKVWLRITKRDNRYTLSTSLDGKVFLLLESPLHDPDDLFDGGLTWGDGSVKRVGLFANNSSFGNDPPEVDASFDFFEVKAVHPSRGDEKRTKPAKAKLTKPAELTESLHQAVAEGDIGQIKSLISKGANIHKNGLKGSGALHWAAKAGRKDVAELLIAMGADISSITTPCGWTPLHLAAMEGSNDVAQLLIAKGAEVNIGSNSNSRTPLHLAVMDDRRDATELLITNGADVDAKDSEGKTALHHAIIQGHKDLAKLLITKGSDINAKENRRGATPLNYTNWGSHMDLAELLIAKGANVNAKSDSGWTPLHDAAWYGRRDIAELLIAKAADINVQAEKFPGTPLHTAAFNGHEEVVDLLIAKGADVNAKNNTGRTPLHLSVRQGDIDTVELLLTKGADVNAKNKWDQTPLDIAVDRDHTEIVELLHKHGAKE